MKASVLAIFAMTAAGSFVIGLLAQSPLEPAALTRPATDSWPTYHGDYTGRHYSTLKQITTANVKGLSLAWVFHTTSSSQGAIIGGDAGAAVAVPRGADPGTIRGADIKAIPLVVNGVAYVSTPGHAFAVDARTGQEIWHYVWKGRAAIGNRGVGMYGNWLFMETGDNRIVSLNASTGQERWHKDTEPDPTANFSTSAPVIIRNHVIIGVGGDSGRGRGWVEALDPETGDVQWKWVVTPDKGDPALATWPSAEAALTGSGGVWQPPSYDPELNLMYITTGQPTPTYNGRNRPGSNLYTCSVVALNPDTGKMAWYYQFSPHDTHDWDATEVPVLIDGNINGQPRKLLAQANRNGYYYLLDRTNGKALVVKKFAWSNSYKGVDSNNVLIADPEKESQPGGVLVFPDSSGATNYPAPAYDPETGLFYTNATDTGSFFFAPTDKTDPSGLGRGIEYRMDFGWSTLLALDYRTGEPKWTHKYPTTSWFSSTYPGMLATAGGVLFTGDPAGNFVAYDARTGASLWHAPMGGPITNTPQTLMMDGKQYVLIAAKDAYYAFYLQ